MESFTVIDENPGIMNVREIIDTAFGDFEKNTVNFKLIQTVLLIMARQLRLLERRVEVEFGTLAVIQSGSSLSITEVKIHAMQKKRRKTKDEGEKGKPKGGRGRKSQSGGSGPSSSDKTSSEKTSSEKTSSGRTTSDKSSTDKTSSGKSTSDKTSTDKTSSGKSTSDKTSTDKTSSGKSTSDKTSTEKTSSGKSTSDKTSTDKTSSGKSTSDKTSTDKTSSGKSTSDKTSTDKTSADKSTSEKTSTDKTSSGKSTTDKTSTDKTSSGKSTYDKTSTDKTSSGKSTSDKTSTDKTSTDKTTSSSKDKSSVRSPTEKTKSGKGGRGDRQSVSRAAADKDSREPADPRASSRREDSDKSSPRRTQKGGGGGARRADSFEETTKSPTPMASVGSIEPKYERLLVVQRVPSSESRRSARTQGRTPQISVVTQEQFEQLADLVRQLQHKLLPVGTPTFPEHAELMEELRKGASLTDAMAALQLSARLEATEKVLENMIAMVTELAKRTPGLILDESFFLFDGFRPDGTTTAGRGAGGGGAYPGGAGSDTRPGSGVASSGASGVGGAAGARGVTGGAAGGGGSALDGAATGLGARGGAGGGGGALGGAGYGLSAQGGAGGGGGALDREGGGLSARGGAGGGGGAWDGTGGGGGAWDGTGGGGGAWDGTGGGGGAWDGTGGGGGAWDGAGGGGGAWDGTGGGGGAWDGTGGGGGAWDGTGGGGGAWDGTGGGGGAWDGTGGGGGAWDGTGGGGGALDGRGGGGGAQDGVGGGGGARGEAGGSGGARGVVGGGRGARGGHGSGRGARGGAGGGGGARGAAGGKSGGRAGGGLSDGPDQGSGSEPGTFGTQQSDKGQEYYSTRTKSQEESFEAAFHATESNEPGGTSMKVPEEHAQFESRYELPVDYITFEDLQAAIKELYNNIMSAVTAITTRSSKTAEGAYKLSTQLESKIDTALEVTSRMNNLEQLVDQYAGQINTLDTGLSSQMTNYQEQLTQMQHDLEIGLETMAEVLANTGGDTVAVAELNSHFTNLQMDFDNMLYRQRELKECLGSISIDLESLWKQIEMLRDIKSDREEVADALRDKAGIGELNGLVSLHQFEAVHGDFEIRIGAAYDKFNNQEIVWQKAIDDLMRELSEKADIIQVESLKSEINKYLNIMKERMQFLIDIVGEPKGAMLSRKLFRDTACLSCGSPAHMDLEEPCLVPALPKLNSGRQPAEGAEAGLSLGDGDHGICYPGLPLPHPRDPRSHICHRYCGGSHTLVTDAPARAPLEIGIVQVAREVVMEPGTDGKMYLVDKPEKVPCKPCNLQKKTSSPTEVIKGPDITDYGDATPPPDSQITA